MDQVMIAVSLGRNGTNVGKDEPATVPTNNLVSYDAEDPLYEVPGILRTEMEGVRYVVNKIPAMIATGTL
jgi:hypothetical protein